MHTHSYLLAVSAAILLSISAYAQSTEIPLIGNVYGRENTQSLNGKWRYIVDQQEIGYYDYRMNETPWGSKR